MKIFVTGHKGFIGQNMCKAVHERGWSLTTFDITDNPDTRPKDLSIEGCDAVIHLGALSSTTETDVSKVMDMNLMWSIELFEKCVANNIQFQWSSSASVYGKRSRNLGRFRVGDVCYPANPYAMSKYLLEQYIEKRRSPIISQGFRYFNVYGPHEDHKGSQASPFTQFARQAKETGVIKVFEGSESIYRDFVHVDYVIQKHLEYLGGDNFGVFNVGTGSPKSFLEVAQEVALIYNAKIETIPFPEHLKEHYQYYTCAG